MFDELAATGDSWTQWNMTDATSARWVRCHAGLSFSQVASVSAKP